MKGDSDTVNSGSDDHVTDGEAANGSGHPAVRHYYVDEAGDPVLFNARGRVIVGEEGCSRFFSLGKLDVTAPDALADSLTNLRQRLLADPYFKGVPSMSSERHKTARLFHAKDDLPEVRREVFNLLANADVRFYAVIRDKKVIADKVLAYNKTNPNYRYHPNQLYDRCVPTLFENRLHQHEAYRIVFARRGSSDRTQAFENGLQQAKERFRQKWRIEGAAPDRSCRIRPGACRLLAGNRLLPLGVATLLRTPRAEVSRPAMAEGGARH